MNELIARILVLSRLDTNHTELKTEAFDLVELLQRIVSDANFEAGRQRVTLIDAPATEIQADPDLLSSAIENVIRNALKYTPQDTPVEVRLKSDGIGIEISVCDRGPGVAVDKLESIFEAFTRLDEARRTDQGGHGIGLALARKVMHKHGGSITARKRASGGLCVSLRLPVE